MNKEDDNRVPSFEELPMHPFIRWGCYPPVIRDKPLNEILRERIDRMSPEELEELSKRLIQISEKFGSGGP